MLLNHLLLIRFINAVLCRLGRGLVKIHEKAGQYSARHNAYYLTIVK